MNRLIAGAFALLISSSAMAGILDNVNDALQDIGAEFSDNFTTNDAGSFASKSRSGYSGGSIRKRVRRTTVQLVSITPPSITASGCGGIDIHFGGFSFIDGDQIRQLLSSYLQGVVGLAFTMAIEQGCPVCKSAMDKMSDLAAEANKMSLDSCAMAQNTVNAAADMMRQACTEDATTHGGDRDQVKSKSSDGTCGSMKGPSEIFETLSSQLDCSGISDTDSAGMKACEDKRKKYISSHGNSTIEILKLLGTLPEASWANKDKWKADLYVSTLGTHMHGTFLKNSLPGSVPMKLLLCGTNDLPSGSGTTDPLKVSLFNELKNVCDDFIPYVGESGGKDYAMQHCAGDDTKCLKFEKWSLTKWVNEYQCSNGCEFPFTKQGLMRKFGDAIVSMQAKAVSGAVAFNPFETWLLSNAPFPLYRLLNLSAFYPGAATDLLASNANSIAVSYATSMADSLYSDVTAMRKAFPGEDGLAMAPPKEMMDDLQKISGMVTVRSTEYNGKEDVARRLNEGLTKQILGLERSLIQNNLNKINGLGFPGGQR